MPIAFGEVDLKDIAKQKKIEFITKHKIDFVDLIEEIQVEIGQETNYNDDYIDNKVIRWKNVIALIDTLQI